MKKRYDRYCWIEFEDGTGECTCLLTKRLSDLGVLIETSGPTNYLTANFTGEEPAFPLVKVFEVDKKYKKGEPFNFDNYKE